MSKLIVEMEMPKACPCDLIGVGYAMWCSAASGIPKRVAEYDECVKNGTRPDWCPIKGVLPDEHGDLVDKETAKNAFDSSFLTFRMKDGETMRGFYQRTIDELPVLIAAEGKDDERTDKA